MELKSNLLTKTKNISNSYAIQLVSHFWFRDPDLASNNQKSPEIERLIIFWTATVTISLAIALLTISATFSINYSNDKISIWKINYIQAILIDLLLCPIASLMMTFVLLKFKPPGKFNFLEGLLDYNLCLLLRTLKWVPPSTRKAVLIETALINNLSIILI